MNRRSRSTFYWRLRRLGFETYDDYLRSPHWKDVKQRFRADERAQDCYCCGDWEDTHLHHRTYERLGAEMLDDLVPLCPRCHSLVHVLERRGDLTLDLAGLLGSARASRYAKQQHGIQARAQADKDSRAKQDVKRAARSWASRLTLAVKRNDADAVHELADELDDLAALVERAARTRLYASRVD